MKQNLPKTATVGLARSSSWPKEKKSNGEGVALKQKTNGKMLPGGEAKSIGFL